MKWSKEAEKTMERVPFFIRKMVRKKVEAYARQQGVQLIKNEHIEACRQKFMKSMDKELKGYSVETCLGAKGCSNRTLSDSATAIVDEIEEILQGLNMKEFLEKRLKHPLKVHNEFRVSISFCPNSCSRPQIVDVGFIGAVKPGVFQNECTMCGSCKEVCQEKAIILHENAVEIREDKCLYCGHCIEACPTGAIQKEKEGFRILVGGKLGRHPQLGLELPGIFANEDAIKTFKKIALFYKDNCVNGERLGVIVAQKGHDFIIDEFSLPSPGEIK